MPEGGLIDNSIPKLKQQRNLSINRNQVAINAARNIISRVDAYSSLSLLVSDQIKNIDKTLKS